MMIHYSVSNIIYTETACQRYNDVTTCHCIGVCHSLLRRIVRQSMVGHHNFCHDLLKSFYFSVI